MSETLTPKVAVVDYEMGNLYSISQACQHVGLTPLITKNKKDILNADAVILPGVGAFGEAMKHLQQYDLIAPIKDFVARGKPFMGICLGMQLLLTESEEFGTHKGLDLIQGRVRRLHSQSTSNSISKIPEVGWNRIYAPLDEKNVWEKTPLQSLGKGEYMYFVHSYVVAPAEKDVVLSHTCYEGDEFCSTLHYKNIFAVQYHPEKSAHKGIEIYHQWALTIAHALEGNSCRRN